MPGHAKITSMITAALTITTMLTPASVKTGMSAFLNACMAMTTTSGSPLSRASLMYSLPSTSSMLERVSRSIDAAKYQPSATAGMTTCRQSPAPEVGSQRSQTENTRISTSPSQKPGIDSPSSATPLATLSHQLLTLTAEMMPAGTPMSTEISVAARPSVSELGKRWKYSSLTGSR